NHRLVGESSHKLNLLGRERLRHRSYQEDHPYCISLAQERDAERSSVASGFLRIMTVVFRVGQHIRKMNQSTFERRSPNNTAPIHRYWALFGVFLKFGREPIPCGDAVEFTLT